MISLLCCDIISSVTELLNGMKKKPLQIMYDWYVQQALLGFLEVLFPNIEVTQKEKSRLMLFSIVIHHWVERNNNNWLYGVHTTQAVTNSMPL